MKNEPETWRRKRSERRADCRVFTVREDFCERESDARTSSFFVIENPDWVNIIALTKTGEVVLIEQFRHGTEEIILELPGGMIDEDEAPKSAAQRELLEETGYTSRDFILVGRSHPNPAIQNNVIFHFLALDCEKNSDTSFDEHESVVTRIISLEDAENLVAEGVITHSLVVAAFHYFSIYSRKKK